MSTTDTVLALVWVAGGMVIAFTVWSMAAPYLKLTSATPAA